MGSVTEHSTALKQRHGFLAVSVLCGAGLAAWFIAHNVFFYRTYTPENFSPYYWPRRYGLVVHISCGAMALTVGLIQLWLGITGRARAWHRRLGRVYAVSVLIGATAALYMLATIPPPLGLYAAGLVGMEVAWILTTAQGYFAIRRGALALHRSWMLRSYVITFSFVVLRLMTAAMEAAGIGTEDSRFDAAAWLSWVIPLLLLELYLRRAKAAASPMRTA
jgi:uncharacterized membrane protein YozB (DUF420 family)